MTQLARHLNTVNVRTLNCELGSYFRFQRTPSFESSITTPFSASSLRIWSARAKLRCFLARVRSATSASNCLVAQRLPRQQLRSHLGHAAGLLGPLQRPAGWLGIAVLDHVERRRRRSPERGRIAVAVAGTEAVPWSMAVFAVRTRSKIGARASAVFRSLASAAM